MQNDVRLIDANALLKSYDVAWMVEYDETGCGVRKKAVPTKTIEETPTIDAVPVVHGRWNDDGLDIKCTVCAKRFDDDLYWIQGHYVVPNYCPNCGAKMDAKEE